MRAMHAVIRKMTFRLAVSFSAVIALVGCASAPTRPSAITRGDFEAARDYVSALIRHRMNAQGVTGLSVALVDDQRVVWAEGFGYADKERNIPATAETAYRAGSISKLFTATAAMQLAEQGRMDIDKPLRDYLPAFSIKTRFAGAAPITPRQLMTHHSGLPGDLIRGMWNEHPEPFTKIVDHLRDEYAPYPPRYVGAYSNLGVTLLGHAIQNVYGEDFAAGIARHVLAPIGMRGASFSVRAEGPLMARAYHEGVAGDDPPLRDVPAGGLNASVNDLACFLQMVFAGGRSGENQVLRPETVVEMLRRQNADVALDGSFSMGLGWILGGLGDVDIRNAGTVAYHGGATLRHNSQLIALPEHKLGVVVLSNSSNARQVVDEVATEAIKLALEAKTGIRQPDKDRARTEAREVPLTEEELQSFPGHYETIAGMVTVRRSGGGLSAELSGKRFDLVSRGDGQLGLRYKLLGMMPVSIGALAEIGLSRTRVEGRDVLYATTGTQSMLVGERISPAAIPAAWKVRLGDYEVMNGDGDFTLPEKVSLREWDGFLLLEAAIPKLSPMPLTLAANADGDWELRILGIGRGKGETIRVVDIEGRECLAYSGYILCKKAG
ncbi:serine hydrolase domain-containing protein [Noviherbaspirillum denitrificans]|uniref:Serine hydrolase n=1 Tax=Noviherbaspirillum denitrificans TaxID=1968433 RepID=A0A254TBR0_9BURK|nr:serine hydrolase domain-containing protein [Noviherbaspirillum denitrificans]OWW20080.1 serine hydrolase [Noviherbaspirillum denitrificans]